MKSYDENNDQQFIAVPTVEHSKELFKSVNNGWELTIVQKRMIELLYNEVIAKSFKSSMKDLSKSFAMSCVMALMPENYYNFCMEENDLGGNDEIKPAVKTIRFFFEKESNEIEAMLNSSNSAEYIRISEEDLDLMQQFAVQSVFRLVDHIRNSISEGEKGDWDNMWQESNLPNPTYFLNEVYESQLSALGYDVQTIPSNSPYRTEYQQLEEEEEKNNNYGNGNSI